MLSISPRLPFYAALYHRGQCRLLHTQRAVSPCAVCKYEYESGITLLLPICNGTLKCSVITVAFTFALPLISTRIETFKIIRGVYASEAAPVMSMAAPKQRPTRGHPSRIKTCCKQLFFTERGVEQPLKLYCGGSKY